MKQKLKITKKILSVFLCVLVVFSCMPMSVISASAEDLSELTELTVTIDTGASVTLTDADKDSYYDIGTADDLYAFAYAVDGGNTAINAELTANIVINEGTMSDKTDSTKARHWIPMGDIKNQYIGIFNGNEYTISGLYFNKKISYVGLFESIGMDGIVKNVGVINSYFNGGDYVGGITGRNEGTISNSYNTGEISGNSDVGGIVGFNYYSEIENSHNTGEISGNSDVGGIVGESTGSSITNSYNTGKISGGSDGVLVGGIVGESDSGIVNSYNTGEVTGDRCVGGIVGIQQGMIKNCYNIGAIRGRIITGGIVGKIYLAQLKNCYNIGEVTSNNNTSSSVVSLDYDHSEESYSSVTNCYYLADVELDGFSETTFKTKEQFASGEVAYLLQADVTDTDKNGTILEIWGQKLGTDAYPLLGGDKVYSIYYSCVETEKDFTNNSDEAVARPVHTFNDKCNGFCAVCGEGYEKPTLNNNGTYDTADDYYEIDNAGKLYWFAEKVNAGEKTINAQLTADIVVNDGTMTDKTDITKVRHWTPIGDNGKRYEGTFNGNNHTVSGLYLNNKKDFVGLFSSVYNNGTVKNVGVIHSYFNGDWYIGGIAGYNYNGTIINSYNAGAVNGNKNVGGVAGLNYEGTITNSYNTGAVNGTDSIGGVVGYNEKGTITNSYNAGAVNGTDSYYIGGVAGENNNGTITNSYNTGTVNGTEDVGGVVGYNYNGTITNSYNTGAVTGAEDVGGVAGYNPSNSSIENNYYLNTVCTGAVNGVDVNGATPKTAEQFASGEVACLLQGENAEIIWGQTLGTDKTPTLGGNKVYYVTNCKGENVYSNINADADGHIYNKTHICKECYALEEGNIAGIYSYQLSLGGNIAVKYYMVLDESVTNDVNSKLVFTVPDSNKTTEIKVADAEKSGDFYVFTCEVSAKEMTSDILCKVVTSNAESDTFTYSVKQYADGLLAHADTNETYAKAVPLVKAMLNYGANTQEYLVHNTDNLANANLSDNDKVLADVDLSEYAHTVTGEQEGISFYGATLSLKTKTEINLYFEIRNDIDIDTLDITVNDEPVEVKKNGEYYQIKITDILAQNLATMYEVKVGEVTVNYGAFSYGKLAMGTDKETLKNTIKALYAYHQEAVEYI